MKLLLLGSTGLLGQAVAAEAARRGWQVRGAARSGAPIALDVADEVALLAILEDEQPDLVFNSVALVDLQQCEEDPGLAYRVNTRPASFLADWSRSTDKPFVHVSTDHFYVHGEAHPHREDEPVRLVNEYARSKYLAEGLCLTAQRALVLRTSIVGIRGWEKPTFAEWAIDVVLSGKSAALFRDAYTSSIDVGSFASAALDLAAHGVTGLVNLAAREVYSKETFVREISRQLSRPLQEVRVESVHSLSSRRASSLGLDVARAEHLLGYRLPNLEAVVTAVVDEYRKG